MTNIAENIELIRAEIGQCETRYRREPGSVRLLAVSKRHSPQSIRTAYASGITEFGENYLQEAEDKIAALSDIDCHWHFIGPIQSNKSRAIAENFDWVQSIDRAKIARRLSEQRPDALPSLNVCVQVKLSDEESKSGVAGEDCQDLCELVASLPRLRLRGLMAIPAPVDDFAEQRRVFHELGALYERLEQRFEGFDTLSMGMSGDFKAAIAEGSTMIRLGTSLFGPREPA